MSTDPGHETLYRSAGFITLILKRKSRYRLKANVWILQFHPFKNFVSGAVRLKQGSMYQVANIIYSAVRGSDT